MLNNLPTDPPLLQNTPAYEEYPAIVVPRDTVYEKLCALAKAAYDFDRQLNEAAGWEFAAAVSSLYSHPISWLLWWAGMRPHKPSRDRWLLIGAGVLLLMCCLTVLVVPLVNELWTRLVLTVVAAGFLATTVLLYFTSQRSKRWELQQTIERSRRGL